MMANTAGSDTRSLAERLDLTQAQTDRLSKEEVLERLLATGCTRLTAERIIERDEQGAEAGRARRRTKARA